MKDVTNSTLDVMITSTALSREAIKEKLFMVLINTEQNKELLATIPHRTWLDLSIAYKIFMGETKDSYVSGWITNEFLDDICLTEKDLYHIAKSNSQKLMGIACSNLFNIILSGANQRGFYTDFKEICKKPMGVYVLTNEHKFLGASVILYDDLMRKIADGWQNDVLIIPSSIHEVLIAPLESEEDIERFNGIVKEVNAEEVAIEDQLSDHVYVYNFAEDEFEVRR